MPQHIVAQVQAAYYRVKLLPDAESEALDRLVELRDLIPDLLLYVHELEQNGGTTSSSGQVQGEHDPQR